MTDNSRLFQRAPQPNRPTSAESFDARLADLQRESDRWRRAFVVMLALFAVALLSGAGLRPAVPDVLVARQFSLVDEDGNERGQWRLGDNGPEFASFEADGSAVGIFAIVGGGVTAPGPLPQPNAKSAGGFIRLGPPEDADEDEGGFDWAD